MLIFNYCQKKTNPAACRQPKSKLQSKINKQKKNSCLNLNSTNQVVKAMQIVGFTPVERKRETKVLIIMNSSSNRVTARQVEEREREIVTKKAQKQTDTNMFSHKKKHKHTQKRRK